MAIAVAICSIKTRITQPALFCTEYALASLVDALGCFAKAMVGHSIGEYVAAHLAGVDVARRRPQSGRGSRSIDSGFAAGSMAAVHLAADELTPLLPTGVEIAAVNGPGLCTISGPDRE